MAKKVLVCLGALFCAVSLFGQDLGTATLSGDVTDSQGAVVRGAKIDAQNKATAVVRSTTTNNAGLFVLNNLAPGDYEVRISSSGFGTKVAQLRLEVGRQQNLTVQLTIQQDQSTISVNDTEAIPLVNTVGSVVDGFVSQNQINDLPLNGRNFLELALLLPGNTPAPSFDPTKSNTILISSPGDLGRGGNISVDGADNNDDVVGGMLYNLPEDAVKEFQIATNRFSAELGRSGSSVVNVLTKSGTNQLHGTGAVFARDSSMQAQSPLVDPTLGSPDFRRLQYTASVGGPVVKDKAWWFTSFEYRDQLGGIEVGARDLTNDTIAKTFASAPLNDGIGDARFDWQIDNQDTLSLKYNIEQLDATGASSLDRSLGSASQRQALNNKFQVFLGTWNRIITPTVLNRFSFSVNNFVNTTDPVVNAPQIDFPSLQDGASFRVPQATRQNRLQWSDNLAWTHGKHNFKFGGELQRIDADFDLGVFQSGRIEAVENFPDFDRNNDGLVNDLDLLFAVTLRSAFPDRPLVIPNADNNYLAFFAQDDWHVSPQLTLNIGLRYELDTDVKDVGHYNEINPIVQPFLHGSRGMDTNNFGPRVGFNWANRKGNLSVHGGYGIYYDRITLEIESLERGLDGRALPIEVRAGNAVSGPDGQPVYLDQTGHFLPGAPTLANPFTGFIFPGAGAGGINIIDNQMQNPMVQQFNAGVQWEFVNNWILKVDGLHDLGTHFIIGVPIGTVYNPVVGGPDVVKNLESSVNTHYDGLLVTVDHRFAKRYQVHAAYTLAKALNYANDDQIPFSNGPIDPKDLHREYGPFPNDQRNRVVLSGIADLPWGLQFSPLWTIGTSVPVDILLPDGSSRIPQLSRNAGCRQFHNGTELNTAIAQINTKGGENGTPLPLVDPSAKFCNNFNSLDLRLTKTFRTSERTSLLLMGEVFNLFNTTNILGVSNTNYSGYSNTLVRDSNTVGDPGYLKSSSFGQAVTTAGGVFGSGGPRAFQLAIRFNF